ncbi:MAG: ferredoxin family protein [Bacteroidota bacterium]|jgi:2-oxoglutarate ferredoxin oxidoreductase subunit delta
MITGTVVVATEICKGCELCIASCPQESLALSTSINRKGYRYAQLVQHNCTGCMNCALVCPDSAITVYRQPKAAKHAAAAVLNAQTA